MSFIANVLPLSLAQYLAQNLAGKQLPIAFSLSEQTLDLDEHPLETSAAQDKIELVVFQQLPLAQLLALQNQVQLNITALTAINHRNNQTSCRFQVRCSDFMQARKALADFALANGIEAALLTQVPTLSEPGLLVMDMDSTTIEIECIDEIAKLAGVGEEVAEVTERAMLGELDFAQSLHQRVATLANSPQSILSDVAKDIPLMAGLKPLIKELKKHNWRIAIASGGFTYFADHLKDTLELDAAFANTLEIIDSKLTGKVLGDVVDAQVKADSLAILSKEYHIPHNQTVAMGDGANDLVMMAAASFGVAFHAKPIVLAQADSSINVQGLDCLLHWLA
ncbi:MAG: phosphoserine phosphatase SerB [Colwellia sp.]|uniref:phosphoserine phosphatase SerB n=1 Tax=Colwellia sp. TaxID=56799 RepID=UPI001D286B76|nr:phosphoserine phosphatase SerB [Colwellia sp.]NQY48390.1 phosphoserine phosphatase SerB [Colwellia sp.]